MANEASYFISDTDRASRAGEIAGADWAGGMNNGGSNAPGLGIATDNPGLEESLPSWTLLDQDGDARAPQVGQSLGGDGFVDRTTWDETSGGAEGKGTDPIRTGTNDSDGLGGVTPIGNATLATLAAGWSSVPAGADVIAMGENTYMATGDFAQGLMMNIHLELTDPDGQQETDDLTYTVGADGSAATVVAEVAALIDQLTHYRGEANGNVLTISAAAAENTVTSSITAA